MGDVGPSPDSDLEVEEYCADHRSLQDEETDVETFLAQESAARRESEMEEILKECRLPQAGDRAAVAADTDASPIAVARSSPPPPQRVSAPVLPRRPSPGALRQRPSLGASACDIGVKVQVEALRREVAEGQARIVAMLERLSGALDVGVGVPRGSLRATEEPPQQQQRKPRHHRLSGAIWARPHGHEVVRPTTENDVASLDAISLGADAPPPPAPRVPKPVALSNPGRAWVDANRPVGSCEPMAFHEDLRRQEDATRPSSSQSVRMSMFGAPYPSTTTARTEQDEKPLLGKFRKARAQRSVFSCDVETLKFKVRSQIMKSDYSVTSFYHDEGRCQRVARSKIFDTVVLVVILLNSIWIGYDADNNDAPVLSEAAWGFQVVENLFCFFFIFELGVRFGAFARKRDCFRDAWFVFDSGLVVLTVLDAWIIPLIYVCSGGFGGGLPGQMDVLRIARVLRVSRVARIVHVLQAMPELMILVKGLYMATQTVLITIGFLLLIIYAFALAFVQMTKDSPLRSKYFSSLTQTIAQLLLDCIIPDQSPIVWELARESIIHAVVMCIFILFGSLIVMNMLIGILVEVVKAISDVEKEQLQVSALVEELKRLQGMDGDGNHIISREEFQEMMDKPEAIEAITNIGVDIVSIMGIMEEVFSASSNSEIPFPMFMEIMLALRVSNLASLKDVLDMRAWLSGELGKVTGQELSSGVYAVLTQRLGETVVDIPRLGSCVVTKSINRP